MPDKISSAPHGEFILFKSADGIARVECRFESDTLWLTQNLMAELYQKNVRTINEHLQNIYKEEELVASSTIRKFRIVREEDEIKSLHRIVTMWLDLAEATGEKLAINALTEQLKKDT